MNASKRNIPTLGVEEEYQLVDQHTGRLRSDCREVLAKIHQMKEAQQCGLNFQHELHLSQIEVASPVCHNLQEVRTALSCARRIIHQAAAPFGSLIVSAATNPLPVSESEENDVTPKRRYRTMLDRYQQLVKELRIFGCHVHVGIPDLETGVQVMNYARLWLPLLQAISTNSPFWEGHHTGYASYRRELWIQWPMAGPPHWFRDANEYKTVVDQLVEAGAIEDPTLIYWDVRLPQKTPTIEFRVFDALTDRNETVAIAAICRAIVMTAQQEIDRGNRAPQIRHELMSAAMWRAARFGISENLICPFDGKPVPAHQLLDRLADWIQPTLEQTGDWADPHQGNVCQFIETLRSQGTGADRQSNYDGDLLNLMQHLHQLTIQD